MNLWHDSQGEGPSLVLLHGWGMNSAIWQPMLAELSLRYRVTLIDLPGHGYSHESSLASSALNEWVEEILVLIPDNSIILGWSLGGLVALQAALQSNDRISGLIMMTATPSFMQRENWQCAMPKVTLETFAENLKNNAKSTLNRFLSLQINGCDNARNLLKQLKVGFAARPMATTMALETGLAYLHDIDLRAQLKNIKIPSIWLYGDKDTLVPACAADSIQSWLPDAQVTIIPGAGHVPFLSHMDRCINEINQWQLSV